MENELKKNNELSIKIVMVVLTILAILTFGVTYAFFSYSRTGNPSSQLITGDVYMHYNEGVDTINIEGIFPESNEEARRRDDNTITFTIDGKNTTTNNDIYYEIKLIHGDSIDGKTRLKDENLRFDLIEEIDGVKETVLNSVSYNDLTNKRIWVNTINRNTKEEIEISYELRMWVSDTTLISDTEDYADYTTDVYKNSFASVRVVVYGDFTEKDITTPASCFAYNIVEEGIEITDYNSDCGSNVVIPNKIDGYDVISIADRTSFDFTEMSNTNQDKFNNTLEFKNDKYSVNTISRPPGVFTGKGLTNVVFPNTLKFIGYYAFNNNELTNLIFPDSLISIGEYAFYGNNLINLEIPNTVEEVEEYAFCYNLLENVDIKGNPSLGVNSFSAKDNVSNHRIDLFKYGGTCDELDQYINAFRGELPIRVITAGGDCKLNVK